VYEAVFLAAHPQSDLVDDGIAGPALGTDVSDQILFARYLKYGPGGEHPADGDLVDSNDSQDAIVFADYSVDANATDFPDLGYSGAPVDSNNAGWTFSSRPADPASTEAIYAQEVYSYTSANILETEV
jgi:hypothetical protein